VSLRFTGIERTLTASDLADVERALGVSIPPKLRRLYGRMNGGVPDKTLLFLPDGSEHEVQRFLPMKYAERPDDTVEGTHARMTARGLLPSEYLPFGLGSGGDFWCVRSGEDAVLFYAMDHADDPVRATEIVTSDVDEMLSLLRSPADVGWT
jgi:hypothetical protein